MGVKGKQLKTLRSFKQPTYLGKYTTYIKLSIFRSCSDNEIQLQIILKILFRVVYTCNWGEENGPGTENEVEILGPIRETAEPDLPLERGRLPGGGGGGGGGGCL